MLKLCQNMLIMTPGIRPYARCHATPVATKPKTKVSFFITDVLMAQNGVEFVAGVDTYNGTTAYTSYDTYKWCDGKELLSGRSLGWEWTTLDQVPGPLDHLGGMSTCACRRTPHAHDGATGTRYPHYCGRENILKF
jgi:hypothetical protein